MKVRALFLFLITFSVVSLFYGLLLLFLCLSFSSYFSCRKVPWIDEKRKHHAYSAMQYIDCVMTFCEKTSKDEQLFPTKYGKSFKFLFFSLLGSRTEICSNFLILSFYCDLCYGRRSYSLYCRE